MSQMSCTIQKLAQGSVTLFFGSDGHERSMGPAQVDV